MPRGSRSIGRVAGDGSNLDRPAVYEAICGSEANHVTLSTVCFSAGRDEIELRLAKNGKHWSQFAIGRRYRITVEEIPE